MRRALQRASPGGVVGATRNLKRYLSRARWVGTQNRYRRNTVARIRKDLDARVPGSLNEKHLAEYVAASVPLHVVDGWAYLGRALQADLISDSTTARHLAYYAELRAAMALLASQGIAVLNRQHFVVTSPTNVVRVPGNTSTHAFAWLALQWWAGSAGSSILLNAAVQPFRKGIADWLSALPLYSSWAPLAKEWILMLGLDLSQMGKDQDSRNEASYRPTRLVPPQHTFNVRSNVDFAATLWLSLEPTTSGFAVIDRHFLRVCLEMAFSSISGTAPGDDLPRYAQFVDSLLAANGVDPVRSAYLKGFLVRSQEPDDLRLIRNARIKSLTDHPDHQLHVMSRADPPFVTTHTAHRTVL
jgi:hypothetical protein